MGFDNFRLWFGGSSGGIGAVTFIAPVHVLVDLDKPQEFAAKLRLLFLATPEGGCIHLTPAFARVIATQLDADRALCVKLQGLVDSFVASQSQIESLAAKSVALAAEVDAKIAGHQAALARAQRSLYWSLVLTVAFGLILIAAVLQ